MKLLVLLFTAHLIAAANDAGLVVWKPSELKKYEQTLRSKPGSNPTFGLKTSTVILPLLSIGR
jgi:hypothetical protein